MSPHGYPVGRDVRGRERHAHGAAPAAMHQACPKAFHTLGPTLGPTMEPTMEPTMRPRSNPPSVHRPATLQCRHCDGLYVVTVTGMPNRGCRHSDGYGAGMSDELPTQRVAGDEYRSCEWCGEAVSQLGTRTPRRYCKRSHRQRAFEARRLGVAMARDRGQEDRTPPPVLEPVREEAPAPDPVPAPDPAAKPRPLSPLQVFAHVPKSNGGW
jgi:hypothetical protein